MSLELIHVRKVFSNAGVEKTVLDDISMHVRDGEFLCILGPSGCGKTTLLNIAAGFIPKSSGSVLFNGSEVGSISPDRIMLFQESSLFPWLSVIQNIEFGLKMSGVGKAERTTRAAKILALVHLAGAENLFIHQLSGGMKQRVALARALVMGSEILLMDEPFSGLDHSTKAGLRTELLRIWKECGTTILFVTHDVEEAILLADRIVVISSEPGRIERKCAITLERSLRHDDDELKNLAAGLKKECGIADEIDE